MEQGTTRDNSETRTSLAAATAEPSPKLKRDGFWTSIDPGGMDAQFRLAMYGRHRVRPEHCATEPSTHFGTRAPIVGYQRD